MAASSAIAGIPTLRPTISGNVDVFDPFDELEAALTADGVAVETSVSVDTAPSEAVVAAREVIVEAPFEVLDCWLLEVEPADEDDEPCEELAADGDCVDELELDDEEAWLDCDEPPEKMISNLDKI